VAVFGHGGEVSDQLFRNGPTLTEDRLGLLLALLAKRITQIVVCQG
jgi:hypothetical protein